LRCNVRNRPLVSERSSGVPDQNKITPTRNGFFSIASFSTFIVVRSGVVLVLLGFEQSSTARCWQTTVSSGKRCPNTVATGWVTVSTATSTPP
jgi:hypothetical protein